MSKPYASIGQALANLGAKRRMYVCNGAYSEPVRIATAVSQYSGLSCDREAEGIAIGAPSGTRERFTLHGGFSLRSRRKLLECIVKGRSREGEPEDEFFTRMMRQIGAVTPDFASACRFALSSTYEAHPVGVPATDECLHDPEIAARVVAEISC